MISRFRPGVSFSAAALAGAVMMSSAAWAARSMVQDRVLSVAELQSRLAQTESDEIPLVLNELVVRELNRFLGTESGRDELRRALAGLAQYRSMVERKLQEHWLPRELLVVPLIESGYTNYYNPEKQNGAGLWGFIPSTARRYDLRVDPPGANPRVDDRLVEEKETVAAARYLRDLHNVFHDWRLALKAYNEGENAVLRQIMDHGTRDVWELERRRESRERYLSRVIAALFIYKNPGLLE